MRWRNHYFAALLISNVISVLSSSCVKCFPFFEMDTYIKVKVKCNILVMYVYNTIAM
jgi:hypothetical protein